MAGFLRCQAGHCLEIFTLSPNDHGFLSPLYQSEHKSSTLDQDDIEEIYTREKAARDGWVSRLIGGQLKDICPNHAQAKRFY